MDPGWSKARDSLKEGASSAKYEVSYQEELLTLMRIRDFISLLLSYPVKLEEEGILNAWVNAFSKWKSQLLSTNDHTVIDKPWRVLTEKAFTCMEGLVPMGKMSQIERGEGSIFNYDNDEIPEAILNLSIDLAVEQLFQVLFSRDDGYAHDICHVRLTTRNLVEKRTVVNKIVAALEDSRNKFGIDKDFLRVLWIDSSKYEGDAEVRIQEEISMVMAGVVTDNDDLLRTKEEMANNKYLVIVVDEDKKVDLGKVCFPAGIVVLITTEPSSKSQAEDFTNTRTMDLNIRTLDHLLPWEVFCSSAGISMVFSSRAIQRIAVKIVEECRGHLLAIVLVAKSLKYAEDVKQWELVLAKLSYINPSFDYQESDRIGNSGVMVNAFVNIIWEGINETQRYCLEVSLFVHKIKKGVPDKILVSDWASALLMSTQERPQRSYELLKSVLAGKAADNIIELLDRSVLLQRESETENVYLPIETYDIIKSLHALNPSIIRLCELELTEPPYIGRWHGLVRIELMYNKISELPESPICPKLKVLLLQGNVDLIDIPDSFFDCMPLLQYLDLSYTSIRDLPASISKLIQLEVFYLRGCDLFIELPPSIGQLKKLLDLELDGTWISHLPKEIRELINLHSLTLCFDRHNHLLGHDKKGKQISSSTIIPPEVISNLTQLKYLSINVDPEDDRWNENVAHILEEISGLWRLEAVSIHVPEAKLLELIPARKTLNFRLVVGNFMHRFISRVTPEVEQKFKSCECSIKFVNGVDVPNQVKRNLGCFKALYLDRHMTIKSLADFELMNLHNLRECILAECNEMETIVDGSYSHDGPALPCLESLTVFYMKNLRSICEKPQFHTSGFLCSLKSMALHTCPMLTTIFSTSFIENLSLLEELIVEDCPKVTTLISHDSSKHEPNIFLPRLRKIWLLYLPELINIFNGLHVGQSLQKMGFYYCPKLQSLSKTELSSKDLRVIKGESKWWETLKWNKTEWEDVGRPYFLNLIFSPITEEADIMAQLAADHDVDEDQLQREREGYFRLLQVSHPPRILSGSSSSTTLFHKWNIYDIVPRMEIQVKKAVQEELDRILSPRLISNETGTCEAKYFRLAFKNEIPSQIFTLSKIKSKDDTPLEVALYDIRSQSIVAEGPLSSIKIEICVLDSEFGSDWSADEFKAKIMRQRDNRRKLLKGNTVITLKDGVGYIPNNVVFTDNSSWTRSGRFRFGAKVVQSTNLNETNIREGISTPFIVRDCRGESYQKHFPPFLGDELWRLKNISRHGKIHQELTEHGINTVGDLLLLHENNPSSLKKIFGKIPAKRCEKIIEHAKTSVADGQNCINSHSPEECGRKRKSSVPLEGPALPAIRVSQESHKIRKPLSPETESHALERRSPVITDCSSVSEFRNAVQHLTGLPEETNSSEKEGVQSEMDDITEMFETNTLCEDEEETVE